LLGVKKHTKRKKREEESFSEQEGKKRDGSEIKNTTTSFSWKSGQGEKMRLKMPTV